METFIVRDGSPQCYGYCSDACLEASGDMVALADSFMDEFCDEEPADEPVEPRMADLVDPFCFDNGCPRCYGLGWIAGLSGLRMRCPKCVIAGRSAAPLIRGGQGESDESIHAEVTAWIENWKGIALACVLGLLCWAACAAWGWV